MSERDPLSVDRELEERFRSKPTTELLGCWLWGGTIDNSKNKGYGVIGHRGKTLLAHRVAWEISNGPIPPGMQIDHLCRTRCCVNPSHLDLVTPKENTLRGFGVTSRLAHQTHCKHGHELSGENLFIVQSGPRAGARKCRACARAIFHRNKRNWKRGH